MEKNNSSKFISLRTKTVIILIIMFIIISTSIFILLNTIMMNRINKLEDKYVVENVTRVKNDINSELKKIYQLAYDWACWDDSYYFITNLNKEYINSNLNKETLSNLKINAMVYINENGEIVSATAMDKTNENLVPIPQDFVEKIRESSIINNSDPQKMVSGILMLPDGAMLIASNPILKSSGDGPVRGNLVMGCYLNDAKITEIAKGLGLNISMENVNQINPSDYLDNIVIKNVNHNEIEGYEILKDINDKPVLKLTVVMSKEISDIGKQGIELVVLYLILITFVSIIIALRIFDKKILMRLENLSMEIRDIGKRRLFSKRVKVDKVNDEITEVTFEINEFLCELEEYQQKIIYRDKKINEINKNLEVMVQQRTNELMTTNKSLHQEIMHRCEMQQKIKKIAYHDYLTDLPNRMMFIEKLNNSIEYASNFNRLVSVMFLDLDSFKMINDSMGHATGDKLLKEVAARLTHTVKKSDMVARIGGDEFVLLIKNITDSNSIKMAAEKVLGSFYEPFSLNDQECFITTSMGIATYPMDGEDSETLLKNADIAMYNAKEKGKNQYVFCAQVKKAAIIENMKLKNKLYRALENKELELYYQPQISCKTEEVMGVEALLRWKHPELGNIPPDKFIPIAEQTGLIIPIGNWIMRTAFKHNKLLQNEGLPKIRMAVNLSIKQFQNKNIVKNVQEALKEADLEPRYVELEITESILMREQNYIIDSLNRLRDLGINIAIDDFGTEYSSLNYLKHLPIDRIKIAMQFVQGLQVNEKDEAITKAILVLAKNMGLGVIAEGVEKSYQLEFLKKRMCDEIQGFYYYRPMAFEQLRQLLRNNIESSQREA